MAVHRNARAGSRPRSQSAMEYLMTYGWAILVVAIVLAALFQLGVFSGVMSPRAQPGTCRVVRPMGAGTSTYASLQGVCTGLLPQFVAQFGGTHSYVKISSPVGAYTEGSFTISLWADAQGAANAGAVSSVADGGWSTNVLVLYVGDSVTGNAIRIWDGKTCATSTTATSSVVNAWHHYSLVDNGGAVALYIDGANVGTGSCPTTFAPVSTLIGAADDDGNPTQYYSGMLANVQIYNSSLDANEILAIYKEGIGGAPIQVRNLIGWWPLNGNTNDTSGDLQSGESSAVTYTSAWTDGYSLR